LLLRAQLALADTLVFSKVRARLGGRLRLGISGAAPLSVEVLEFFHSLNMLVIALELAADNPVYEDIATKFFEHFLYIAGALNAVGVDTIPVLPTDPGDQIEALVHSLDTQTPEVLIEARIVETTKIYNLQYGFSWSFNGLLDPALGTMLYLADCYEHAGRSASAAPSRRGAACRGWPRWPNVGDCTLRRSAISTVPQPSSSSTGPTSTSARCWPRRRSSGREVTGKTILRCNQRVFRQEA